jgi:aspartyl-tRNA(Asn)/glutamyl-tRNA(Gln) amidotransferase subunit A
LSAYRLAVARTVMLDGWSHRGPGLRAQPGRIARGGRADRRDPLNETAELAGIQATGGFSAAESYAWHRELLATRANDYDPRVATRIQRGATMMAHEYLDLLQARQRWIRSMEQALRGYDAVLSPTVPILAPLLADVRRPPARTPPPMPRATKPSSGPMPCCCATPAWSTCWMAVPCRCLATPGTSCRWA